MGGTGEGVKRWERLGREHGRKRMCDAPESGIWGEERETSRVWLGGRGDTVERRATVVVLGVVLGK
jgi:hypothetical protein